MKRKAIRAVRAADKPPRRKAFSKVDYKRAITVARSLNLPVKTTEYHPDGSFSLVHDTGKNSGDDPINEQQLKDLI